MSRPDPAGVLLAVAVRLLPAGPREWGTAMRAELAGVEPGPQRLSFALGCVRVIATRPAVWRHVGYPLLMLGVLGGTLRWTAQIGYPPLRSGLSGLVISLAVVACLGRVRPFGPVADRRAARGMRAGGYLLIGVLAGETVWSAAHEQNLDMGAVSGLTVAFTGYLLAFLALTARRCAATSRTLTIGALAGTAAGAAWTLVVLAFPPIPPDIGLAVLATALGMGAAMQAVRRRGEGDTGLLAGVCAGTVATLLIIHAVLLLSSFGPARLIPDLVPAALSPADDLANSRIEIQDPYVWMLLFGWLIGLGQCVAALTVPRRTADATDPTLGGRSDLR